MRYNSTINNIKAKEWGLSIQQAYLFSWFYELPSWANKVMIENEIYYFASKTKAVEELPILTEKTDTMYRYYKQLEEKKLIIIKKIDNKDYISLTEKGKEWNFCKSDGSEIYPTKLGNLSEISSENNPTYNNIILDNNINDNNTEALPFSFLKSLIFLGAKEELAKDWLKVRKTKKMTNTQTAFDTFKKELEKSGKPINEVLTKCCSESWGGFKASWDWKENNNNQKNSENGERKFFKNR